MLESLFGPIQSTNIIDTSVIVHRYMKVLGWYKDPNDIERIHPQTSILKCTVFEMMYNLHSTRKEMIQIQTLVYQLVGSPNCYGNLIH